MTVFKLITLIAEMNSTAQMCINGACFKKQFILRLVCLLVVLYSSVGYSQNQQLTESTSQTTTSPLPSKLLLSFNQPGTDWESETLPLGNGHLGASILGGVKSDIIQFNEKTLWTGGPNSTQGYDFGIPNQQENYPEKIQKVQQLLQNDKTLAPKLVAQKLGRAPLGYGSYQSFADIKLTFDHDFSQTSHYQRSLDLNTAIANVHYQYKGVTFTREYFVSYPENIIVVKLSSDKAHQLNLFIDLAPPKNRTINKSVKIHPNNSTASALMTIKGQLDDNKLAYESQLALMIEQGKVSQTNTGQLKVSAADSIWFVVSAGTNYRPHYPDYRGAMPDKNVSQQIAQALTYNYNYLKQRHLSDHQALFQRVSFNLTSQMTASQLEKMPIDQMLMAYKADTLSTDARRALEVLYYQFGRYLLISSSRAGSLPANLQGVWNKDEFAPWSADYHVNINLQMNYWLADMTNLAETNMPLFDFIDSLVEPGELAAKRIFGVNGWTMFLNTNVWGFTGLISWPTAFWQPEGAAWLALHYFDHYAFNQDQIFLKDRAYPVLKKASEFWLNALVLDKSSGTYLVTPSYSPEHGDFSQGAAMSQQIVAKLLDNTLKAANILDDQKMVGRISAVIKKLDPGLRIGSWGQLQEWQQDLDDKATKHRHVSHLFALHPSNSISPLTTPNLAQAAKVSLTSRGDAGTGWSKAWKINFWARLFDGDHAYKLLSEQLKHSTLTNLWDNHPPFQIDGNFGATAGISEMLLQSQNNEIHLLPALPSTWPDGEISGLKARGNIEVGMKWHSGKLASAKIKSRFAQPISIRAQSLSASSTVVDQAGKIIATKFEQGLLIFNAKEQIYYQIKP